MIKKIFWNNKRVLITGYNGFKGSWMVLCLSSLGCKIFGYSLESKENKKNEKIFGLKKLMSSYRHGDIRNSKKFFNYIQKSRPDIIIHMASQPLVIESIKNPRFNFETNFNGLLNLLISSKKINKKIFLLILTSDKCYENNDKSILTESSPLGGDDPYSASKACAEILSNSFRKTYNMNISTVRAGNVIGGGDWNKDRLIPDLIKSIFLKKKFIFRNSSHSRPWQHVIDINFNYLKIIEFTIKKKIKPGNWNLGPPSSFQNKYIINYFKSLYNLKIKRINKNLYKEKKNIFNETDT